MLHIVLWKWQQKDFRERYTYKHVNTMVNMLKANVPRETRIVCVTDDPVNIDPPCQTHPLWGDHDDLPNVTGRHLPSCYRRLRLFDEQTQRAMGIAPHDRVMSLDLDAIVTGDLRDMLKRVDQQANAEFVGWGVKGTYHPRVFNGSMFSFRSGPALQHIWSTFNPKESPRAALKKGFLGSDQGWLSLNFAGKPNAYPVLYPEIASYPREVRRLNLLDKRTKIVMFHGARKPWHPLEFKQQLWIKNYYKETL